MPHIGLPSEIMMYSFVFLFLALLPGNDLMRKKVDRTRPGRHCGSREKETDRQERQLKK